MEGKKNRVGRERNQGRRRDRRYLQASYQPHGKDHTARNTAGHYENSVSVDERGRLEWKERRIGSVESETRAGDEIAGTCRRATSHTARIIPHVIQLGTMKIACQSMSEAG